MLSSVVAVSLCATLSAGTASASQDDDWSRDFYWGVASSGYQSEGSAPDSNWKRFVDRSAGKDGVDHYRDSVDFRHRYADDIRLAAGLGVNTYRFGIEWARVEPSPGRWDEAELAFYDDVFRQVRAAGMTPMITLNHWVYPGWALDQGGWAESRTADAWLAFSRKIVQRYAGQDVLWVTFNEPLIFLKNEQKVGALNATRYFAAQSNIVQAHRRAYDLIHELDPTSKVTSNQAYITGVNGMADWFFLDQVKDKLDFIGIDYYYGLSIDNWTVFAAATDKFWDVKLQPEGIYYALRSYHDRFPRLPLYIVENGMATDNGKLRDADYTRGDHVRDTVYWLQRAKADGMNLIGYNYWSLTDNYEWGSYRARFGLYTVDALTDPALTRRPTDAVPAYQALVTAGGVPQGFRLKRGPGTCSLVDGLNSCLNPAKVDGPLMPLK